MPDQKRLFYGVQSCHFAECGTTSFTAAHGVQSFGMNTNFQLDPVFEMGQTETYQLVENLPQIEVTMEKVLDGYPLLWHLATKGATSGTIAGRSNKKTTLGFATFSDQQDSASGTALAQCMVSGLYIQSLNYSFPVNGNFTEQVTLVGNNKVWNAALTLSAFDNTDEPLAIAGSGGVNRRQNMKMGSSASLWPTDIVGITSSGTNEQVTGGTEFRVHFGDIRISCNLGREELFEQGRRGPYHRYTGFPIQVTTDIDYIAQSGDFVQALDTSTSNVSNRTIKIMVDEGSTFNMGTKNKLTRVSHGGANAGQNGGNATISLSYINYGGFLTVTHPQDPSGL